MNNDLISREALKKEVKELLDLAVKRVNDTPNNSPCFRMYVAQENERARLIDLIDNAPTVKAFTEEDMAGAYNEGYACGSRENTRPQGECKNCKHFQESLCENSPNGWCLIRRVTQEGDLETQVPKDYYCSWFEKGGAE